MGGFKRLVHLTLCEHRDRGISFTHFGGMVLSYAGHPTQSTRSGARPDLDGSADRGLATPNDLNQTERLGMVPAMPGAVVHELPTSLREEQPIRLLIADDQRLFRLGLAQLLGADSRVEVVGLASDGEEAVLQCEELRPDVAMLDLRMTGVNGLEATRRIVALDAGIKVVILTASVRDGDVACAFESGASGYVLKDSDADALVQSVLAVHLGAQVVTGTRDGHGPSLPGTARAPGGPEDKLTPSEHSILRLVAAGHANREIARQMGISEKTVRNHMSHIYDKLDVRDRSGALLFAINKGLVEA
jgi:DNA-binding NarL/FixJ family response regulator